MSLGSPKTNKALIGTFELRLGPLSKSGLLTSDHSVGIIDQVKLDMNMESVDLLSGFPQIPTDTGITKFVTGFTATLRESSRRNLNVLLGNGLADYDTSASDIKSNVVVGSGVSSGAVSLPLSSAITLSQGAIVVVYDVADPGNVSVCRVAASSSGTTVTLDPGTPIQTGFTSGKTVKIYKASTIPGGAIDGVPKYFGAQLVRLDRGTGRPVGFNFWKCTISSGISLGASITEFASLEMQLKALVPAAVEYSNVGSMPHLANIIPYNPVFQVFDVSDTQSVAAPVSPNQLYDSLGSILKDSTGSNLISA